VWPIRDAVTDEAQDASAAAHPENIGRWTAGRYRNPLGLWIGRCFLLLVFAFVVAYPGPPLLIVASAVWIAASDVLMRRKCVEVSDDRLTLHYMFSSWPIPWHAVLRIDTASGTGDAGWGGEHLYLDTTDKPRTRSVRWVPFGVEEIDATTPDGQHVRAYRVELPAIPQGTKVTTPDGTRTRDARAALQRDLRHVRQSGDQPRTDFSQAE